MIYSTSLSSTLTPSVTFLFSSLLWLLYLKHKQSKTLLPNSDHTSKRIASKDVKGVDKKARKITILYGTTTGTAKKFSQAVYKAFSSLNKYNIAVYDLKEYELDNLESEDMVILICSTWTNGVPPENCASFFEWMNDLNLDFRVSRNHLQKVKFAMMGLGGKVYNENFCKPVRKLYDDFLSLGAKPLLKEVFLGDDASDLETVFTLFMKRLMEAIGKGQVAGAAARTGTHDCESGGCMEDESSCCKSQDNKKNSKESNYKCGNDDESDIVEEEDLINDRFVMYDSDEDDNAAASSKPRTDSKEGVLDLEDLGSMIKSSKEEAKVTNREMVTKMQRKALTKEGYKIIGTHSAVKICRWTKNQLRGRGGCYKHSFYGITSYQCMEATPSLACANKCVFCWRHHKNPVGTEWRWKTDSPDMIVENAIGEHVKMVNQLKGVPGIVPERMKEAYTVRHCALSLVGEPIMYPQINEMVKLLHDRKISTFLVTNAQFPDCIKRLDPVTQLYVSVDAATKDSLKAVDRPLFRDFWDRFLSSLKALKEKKQRTVYRMTLVKNWNMNEVEDYCSLIEIGEPDFIEIKAVTYCGKSDASSLTMENVPWHYEVCTFAEAIADKLRERQFSVSYNIATEHEHSCCILLAREDKFKIDGDWYTWIDYSKFDELIHDYYESGGVKTFVSSDYIAKTPAWALYKSAERGFDPSESRYRKLKSGALAEVDYKPSDSGCG